MTHFSVLVLAYPEASDSPNIWVEEALAPYDENREVEEREVECWCIGEIARRAGFAAAAEKFGVEDWSGYRALFDTERRQVTARAGKGADEEALDAQLSALWRTYVDAWQEVESAASSAHELAGKPTPDCDSCEGTGLTDSTANPDAKWDWWQIGGRWSGALTGYEPEEDPRNWETCRVCAGTGNAPNAAKFEAERPGWIKQMNGCNGCHGKGWAVRWPTDWVSVAEDVLPVQKVLAREPLFVPTAVVTPEGDWIDQGDVGWWGMISNAKEDAVWEEEVKKLYEEHRDKIAIVVDCHI